jgi:ABC-type sugar transport system ATPase subunit
MCDRIAVMRRGELAECRSTGDWTEATLMTTAIGTEAPETAGR